MANRLKVGFEFPRFFEVTSRTLEEPLRTVMRNLVREIENLHKELGRVININVADDDWTAVSSFTNSWVNFGGSNANASYMKVSQDLVILKGTIKTGTVTSSAFTLPEGYRPAEELIFGVGSNGAFGELLIQASGNVVPNVGSNTEFSLDGVIFRAEA